MSLVSNGLPYTKKRLEDLAVAMGVNSAYLWVSPVTNTLALSELAANKVALPAALQGEDEDDQLDS